MPQHHHLPTSQLTFHKFIMRSDFTTGTTSNQIVFALVPHPTKQYQWMAWTSRTKLVGADLNGMRGCLAL